MIFSFPVAARTSILAVFAALTFVVQLVVGLAALPAASPNVVRPFTAGNPDGFCTNGNGGYVQPNETDTQISATPTLTSKAVSISGYGSGTIKFYARVFTHSSCDLSYFAVNEIWLSGFTGSPQVTFFLGAGVDYGEFETDWFYNGAGNDLVPNNVDYHRTQSRGSAAYSYSQPTGVYYCDVMIPCDVNISVTDGNAGGYSRCSYAFSSTMSPRYVYLCASYNFAGTILQHAFYYVP